ncbi:MAG TPA: hypothetical protein V6C88_09550, partial [Chroococcidiopsis sp.]
MSSDLSSKALGHCSLRLENSFYLTLTSRNYSSKSQLKITAQNHIPQLHLAIHRSQLHQWFRVMNKILRLSSWFAIAGLTWGAGYFYNA